jgi:hypothetical protein
MKIESKNLVVTFSRKLSRQQPHVVVPATPDRWRSLDSSDSTSANAVPRLTTRMDDNGESINSRGELTREIMSAGLSLVLT